MSERPLLKTLIAAAALTGGLAGAGAAHATGKVEVQFIAPEKFSDAGHFAYDRERTLAALREILQSLGKELPDGQVLKLDVLDIDLAGSVEPVRSGELRILRNRADWPHMKLRYTLQSGSAAGSSTLKSGTADLADMNYMQSLRGAAQMDGAYGYEKRMVQQWFRTTLLAP